MNRRLDLDLWKAMAASDRLCDYWARSAALTTTHPGAHQAAMAAWVDDQAWQARAAWLEARQLAREARDWS